jgi:hypothetical protein
VNAVEPAAPAERPRPQPNWQRRIAIAVGVVCFWILAGWIGAAFLPRWWAHRIADQTHGSFAAGITIGLFYGFVFTVIPFALILWGAWKRRSWKSWLLLVCVAILLAVPNLLTLGIVLGNGDAAHAGQRTLDVDSPGFRASSLIGGVVALVLVLLVAYLLFSHRRVRRRADRLEGELDERDVEDPASPAPPSPPAPPTP